MTYKINGREVTKEEFQAWKPAGWRPLQPGDRVAVFGAEAFSEFVSPIDGEIISSKQALKNHELKHNVVQVGTDLKNTGNHGLTREESINKQKGNANDTGN